MAATFEETSNFAELRKEKINEIGKIAVYS